MSKQQKKLKIMTVFGTRPEIIRLSRILPKMDKYFSHIAVYTQQSYDYELSRIFFDELELRKPDYLLEVRSDSLGGQIGNILEQTEEVMLKEKPDALLVLGDTNSSLAVIMAKRYNILIFHMEAGNRCFDWEVPEETNRALVDIISDYNLPYTERGRTYLLHQGIHPSKIFVTGSPMAEIYEHFKNKIAASDILNSLKLAKKQYFVVSTHREENVENKKSLRELFDSFNFLADEYGMPLIVSLHPRTKKRIKPITKINPLIQFHKPFGMFDYIKLQQSAFCVLSDSGTIQEESSILDFPAVQVRRHLERPEAFDKGIIILTGLNTNSIASAIDIELNRHKKGEKMPLPDDYKDKNVSTKVVKLIQGLASINKYHDYRLRSV